MWVNGGGLPVLLYDGDLRAMPSRRKRGCNAKKGAKSRIISSKNIVFRAVLIYNIGKMGDYPMSLYPTIQTPMSKEEARALDALVLAYVGDGVQSLYVRTYFAATVGGKAGALHSLAVGKVSAVAQAEEVDAIRLLFNEEEDAVYRTARNHKSKSTAKNARVSDYRKASGLEAVWGYLYLTGQNERLGELLSFAHGFED